MKEQIFIHTDWQEVPAPTEAELRFHNIPPRERRKRLTRKQRMDWKPLSPLGGKKIQACAKGRSPKEVQFMLEDGGVEVARRDGIAFSSVEVENISARDPETGEPNYPKCNLQPPDMTLSGVKSRLTRAERELRECEQHDIACIAKNIERIEELTELTKTLPVYADVKCYCGEVIVRQTEQDKHIT